MKVLDSRKLSYKVHAYPEGERDAGKVAELIGKAPEMVFKTLVIVRIQGKPLLVVAPGSHKLDLKKVAKAIGDKKVKLATHRQAEELTGLRVGGISPLALLNKGFINILDRSARDHRTICISAGKKGLNVELAVVDLRRVIQARYEDVIS